MLYVFIVLYKRQILKIRSRQKKENNVKNIMNLDNQILKDIFTLPFSIYKTDYTNKDSLYDKYENNYVEFIAYYRAK